MLGVAACSDDEPGGGGGGTLGPPEARDAVGPFRLRDVAVNDPWLPTPMAPARWLARDVRAQTIVNDLELVLGGDLEVERGDVPNLALTVFNRSERRAHAVVNASDGSREGWREPHLFFDVEIRDGEGPWRTARRARYVRCGNYDTDWTKDIVTLAPNESLDLDDVIFPYGTELEEASEIRITAHYRYGVTRGAESLWRARNVPPAEIAGVPDFELVSTPFVVRVRSSVRVELTPSLDVVLTNDTDVERPIAQNGRASLELVIEEPAAFEWTNTAVVVETRPDQPALAPHERRIVAKSLGTARATNGERIAWDHVRRSRARYTYATGSGGTLTYRDLTSHWHPRESLLLR